MEWGFLNRIPLNSKIEVLKYKNKNEFEINSFFYYWLTLNTLKYIFCCGFITTFSYLIYTDKKK